MGAIASLAQCCGLPERYRRWSHCGTGGGRTIDRRRCDEHCLMLLGASCVAPDRHNWVVATPLDAVTILKTGALPRWVGYLG